MNLNKNNTKKKNKGKVHPSPLPSSPTTTNKDAITALNLLPAAILTIIALLSTDDREVLAYLITRSIKASANPSVLLLEENRRRRSKHKSPAFHCGCFDCYTAYWFRWDSSPNRELIHQAIEAFEEDNFSIGDQSNSNSNSNSNSTGKGNKTAEMLLSEVQILESFKLVGLSSTPQTVELPVETSEINDNSSPPESEKDEKAPAVAAGGNHSKGLARKVLPDVIGLFHSRLWSLWSPN